jgi:hypothetical protein
MPKMTLSSLAVTLKQTTFHVDHGAHLLAVSKLLQDAYKDSRRKIPIHSAAQG